MRSRAFLALFLAAGAAGCTPSFEPGELTSRPLTEALPEKPRSAASYEEALARFAVEEALERAENEQAWALAGAVESVMKGRIDEAKEALDGLRDASDPPVRDRANALLDKLKFGDAEFAQMSAPALESPLMQALASAPPETIRFPNRTIDLPMGMAPSGVPTIAVDLGNGRTEQFWIDTGSGLSVIGASLAEAIGAEPLAADGATVGTGTSQRQDAGLVVIPELGIGDASILQHTSLVLDDAALRFSAPDIPEIVIPGIIGWPILARLRVELDYGGRRVRLSDPAKFEAPADRNLFWFGYPVVRVRAMSGAPLFFGLDSGAHVSTLTPWGLGALGVPPSGHREVGVWSAGRSEKIRAPILEDFPLAVTGHVFTFDAIHVVNDDLSTVFAVVDGVLGSDVLGKGRVVIDATNGQFEVIPGPAAP